MIYNLYTFEYSTKTCSCRHISYAAGSFPSALRRFKRNIRYTNLIQVFKNGRFIYAVYGKANVI